MSETNDDPTELSADPERVVIEVPIEGTKVLALNERNIFERLLIELLALATGRDPITDPPESRIRYDDWGPQERIEEYGTTTYGLKLSADPIQSGIGVHGEHGYWVFHGLPEGVRLSAEHKLDMRGGSGNFVSVTSEGPPEFVSQVRARTHERLAPYRSSKDE